MITAKPCWLRASSKDFVVSCRDTIESSRSVICLLHSLLCLVLCIHRTLINLSSVPRVCIRFGSRSFATVAPTIWNTLSLDIPSLPSLGCFIINSKHFSTVTLCFSAILVPHFTLRRVSHRHPALYKFTYLRQSFSLHTLSLHYLFSDNCLEYKRQGYPSCFIVYQPHRCIEVKVIFAGFFLIFVVDFHCLTGLSSVIATY